MTQCLSAPTTALRAGSRTPARQPLHWPQSRVRPQSFFHLKQDCVCAAGRFIRGEIGTNVCPPGSAALKTVPECKRAAEAMLQQYVDQANTPHFPKGCYAHVDGAFFNFGAHGSAEKTTTPICRDLSTPSPTVDGQTMAPTVAPSSTAVAPSKFWLVGNGTCTFQRVTARGKTVSDELTARVKLVSDERVCADVCEVFQCVGYAYVHSGEHAKTCWVYGEKLEEGLPRYVSGQLATPEWQGRIGSFSQAPWVIRGSSGADNARCMLHGTHTHARARASRIQVRPGWPFARLKVWPNMESSCHFLCRFSAWVNIIFLCVCSGTC